MNGIPIYINKFEYDSCVNFAVNSIGNQRELSFGQKGESRGEKEMYENTLQGKLGEIAFKKFLDISELKGMSLDFEVYPKGQWDNGVDICVNKINIDVKSVKSISKWFLLEVNKTELITSDVFVITSLRYSDTGNTYIDLKGFTSKSKILSQPVLKRGECIPNTGCKLKTDNYSMPISSLCSNWSLLLDKLSD